jgi:hypothetical protein
MCKIDKNIKFCTCVAEDIYSLDHYWVLHRLRKDKDLSIILGMALMPSSFFPSYHDNLPLLLKALNDAKAFDQPLAFKRWDRMEIVLCSQSEQYMGGLRYHFRCNGKVWQHIEEDDWSLLSKFEEVEKGRVG